MANNFGFKTVAKTAPADYVCSDYPSDDVAIQKAINEWPAVLLHPGTYDIKNLIRIKKNVQLAGLGPGVSILRLDPASLPNFLSGFLIHGDQIKFNGTDGTNCVVRDLTLDGNYANLVSPPPNHGGLMKPLSGWLVENVEFKTSNHFKLYLDPNVHDITIRHCKWTGTTDAGADCLGGTQPYNITIEDCTWEASTTGNPVDIVTGQGIKLLNNMFRCKGFTYYEGCIRSDVIGNEFNGGGGIFIETNIGYQGTLNAVNPHACNIKNNRVISAVGGAGITFKYDPKGMTSLGGYNQITGNIVERCSVSGIAIGQANTSTPTDCSRGFDLIMGNTCRNNNQGNVDWFGGLKYPPSGINIVEGVYYTVVDNVCTDDQANKTQRYGIAYGHFANQTAYNEPDYIVRSGNTTSGNKLGGEYFVSHTTHIE